MYLDSVIKLNFLMIIVISCLHGAYGLPLLGQKYCIRAFLSLEKWSFYSLSVMGHSLYWRRIWGRLWTKSSYWWTLCIKFKKICSNKKMTTVESRSELQLYCTSTHCHIQLGNQRLLVIVLFPLLVAGLSSSFVFSFPFRHLVSMFVPGRSTKKVNTSYQKVLH